MKHVKLSKITFLRFVVISTELLILDLIFKNHIIANVYNKFETKEMHSQRLITIYLQNMNATFHEVV